MEFIFTFAFVFTWLIVRNYELKGEMSKVQNLIKPIFVFLTYEWAVASQAGTSSGVANPMLAIIGSIWDRVSYDYIFRPNPQTDPTD
jgi:glycerol uptake facilitator-like aquaporin